MKHHHHQQKFGPRCQTRFKKLSISWGAKREYALISSLHGEALLILHKRWRPFLPSARQADICHNYSDIKSWTQSFVCQRGHSTQFAVSRKCSLMLLTSESGILFPLRVFHCLLSQWSWLMLKPPTPLTVQRQTIKCAIWKHGSHQSRLSSH